VLLASKVVGISTSDLVAASVLAMTSLRTWLTLCSCLAAAAAGAQSLPPGEGPAPRRADAKAYQTVLEPSKRLPKIGSGELERRLPSFWRPPARGVDDPVLDERPERRRLIDAACDADLAVIGHVASARPFLHPNGRWILTAHDLVVTTVVRAAWRAAALPSPVRYVHPSGSLAIGERVYTTSLDRFPPLTSDEEHLFFLVRIGRSRSYRASLAVPLLVVRGGVLQAHVLPEAAQETRAMNGLSAREAGRIVNDAVCRQKDARPTESDSPRDEFIRSSPAMPIGPY
jgi:hypothetical protein